MALQRSGDGDPYNVTWGAKGDFPTDDFQQSDADGMLDNFVTRWASSIPDDCTIGPLTIRYTPGVGGDPLVFVADNGDLGTNTGAFLPQNCAVLIRKRSALGGRRNIGRIYMPIASEAAFNEIGAITATQLASYQSICNSWLNDFDLTSSQGTTEMSILHSYDWDLPGPDPGPPVGFPDPTEVTGLVVTNTLATQRRRLRH